MCVFELWLPVFCVDLKGLLESHVQIVGTRRNVFALPIMCLFLRVKSSLELALLLTLNRPVFSGEL
jgi:hypothetical protein